MQNKESLYPADRFEKAKKDLEGVRPRLSEGDLEDAAVHLQQAIEKYLKGWKLKKTLDLRTLFREALKYNPNIAKFSDLCKEVSTYYLEERYPFFVVGPSEEEIRDALLKAEELIQELMKTDK